MGWKGIVFAREGGTFKQHNRDKKAYNEHLSHFIRGQDGEAMGFKTQLISEADKKLNSVWLAL